MKTMNFKREYPAERDVTVTRFSLQSTPSEGGILSGEMFTEGGVKVATFAPSGKSVVRLSIEHDASGEDRAVWRVSLSLRYLTPEEEATATDWIRAEVANGAEDAPSIVRLASDFWMHWYRTGTSFDRSLLCRLLGVWSPLDAVVAALFLSEAENHTDAISKCALETMANDPMAKRADAKDRLSAMLSKHLPDLRGALVPNGTVRADETEGGLLAWDERLARWLDGQRGRNMARDLRSSAAPSPTWAPWLPTPSGEPPTERLALAAMVLWTRYVKPAIEQEKSEQERNPRALVRAVYAPFVEILSAPPMRKEEESGQCVLDLGIPQVCAVRADLAEIARVEKGIELFRSIYAHQILQHITRLGWERASRGIDEARVLVFDGGYGRLAEEAGIRGGQGAVATRAIVDALCHLELSLYTDHKANLIARTFTPAQGQRKARLEIVLGTMLLPRYVFDLKKSLGSATEEARRFQDLIPLLPIAPTIGRPNDAGPQATLQLRTVAHLRDNARDLAGGHGAKMTAEQFSHMASLSSVPRSLHGKVLEHWQKDHGPTEPALLKRLGTDRYTLGDAHKVARAFLEQGGRLSLVGVKAGRQSAAKREDARRRLEGAKKPSSGSK